MLGMYSSKRKPLLIHINPLSFLMVVRKQCVGVRRVYAPTASGSLLAS